MAFFFPLRRLRVLVSLTFQELLNQKVIVLFSFLFFLFLGMELLTAFVFQEGIFLFQEMFFGIFSLFLSLLAIVASAPLLSLTGEEVMILSRPLSRIEYFFGKLLGAFLLLLVATCCMGILFLFFDAALEIGNAMKVKQMVFSSTSQVAWITFFAQKIILIGPIFMMTLMAAFLKACLLAAMTLLISTVATSSFFTIFAAIAFYFIGHLEATALQLWVSVSPRYGWMEKMINGVTCMIPDLSLFNLSDRNAMSGAASTTSFFSIMELGFIYLFIYCVLGCFLFQQQKHLR